MSRLLMMLSLVVLCVSVFSPAQAYLYSYDFNTAWSSDYAPGWENGEYRWGEAPVGKMMEHYYGGRNGTTGMRLVAVSTPEEWMWWASVIPTNLEAVALQKQYDPWISVWYYDVGWENGDLHSAGQLFTVPSWTNLYLTGTAYAPEGEDWTDVQFGARMNQPYPNDNYYYVAAGENSPGWQDTGVDRATQAQWVNLKMQLSSADGKIHFYIRNSEAAPFMEVGTSYRSDYIDLGTETGLYTMFTSPLSAWPDNKPSTIWDDFEVGSNYVPEPMSVMLGVLGLGSVAGLRRLRRK